MAKYRFHALGLAHTITNPDYMACAFTTKVLRFCKMMTERGHHVIHYGHPRSAVTCTEHVSVISEEVYDRVYGQHDFHSKFFTYDLGDEAYRTFTENAAREINARKQRGDFLLCFWGAGHRPIADRVQGVLTVEPGIGYPGGLFARWRVYESYAVMHALNGPEHVGRCLQDWYHVVIPNYFDPADFEYRESKDDYCLFLGRVYSGKGLHIAVQVCERLGIRLLVAGQGSLEGHYKQGPLLEHVGFADVEKRRRLLAGARCLIAPSLFCEPFCGVTIEALLSGTPIITPDWGVFAENNVHGVTGWRCRTFQDFCWGVSNAGRIDPKACRDFAVANFTLDTVARMYERYFQMVHDVEFGEGWYAMHDDDAEESMTCRIRRGLREALTGRSHGP